MEQRNPSQETTVTQEPVVIGVETIESNQYVEIDVETLGVKDVENLGREAQHNDKGAEGSSSVDTQELDQTLLLHKNQQRLEMRQCNLRKKGAKT
jgi:hypothetical protein